MDVMNVREVLRDLDMTEVPLAPRCVKGLINLRGQIVTAVDLRECLNLPARAPGGDRISVIMESGSDVVSLIVDAIGDVEQVADDCLSEPPDTLDAHTSELLASVCKLDRRLLLLVDPAAVVRSVNREPGDRAER
jgi:purine-binding chemotaxis protein CheW